MIIAFKSRHSNTEPVPLPVTVSPTATAAFHIQDQYGWEGFLLGFLVKEWELTPSAYLLSIQSKLSPKRWCTTIIRKLWDIAWDLWDHRNGFIHNRDTGCEIEFLNAEITKYYRNGHSHLSSSAKELFRQPLAHSLQSSLPNKQLWVQRSESAHAMAERNNIAGGLMYTRVRELLRNWLAR